MIPDEFSLLLGEQLYQLRAVLDALIFQATAYATGKNPPPDEEKLEFPITWNESQWPDLVKRRLSALPVGIQKAIRGVQPFTSTSLLPKDQIVSVGRSLGILNDLARRDRHRQLHIMGSWPLEVSPVFDLPSGVTVSSVETMPPSVLNEGTVIARFRLDGFQSGMEVRINPQMKTNIGCQEPSLPAACDPSDTFDRRLAEMVNAVGAVLAAFENQY